MKKTLLGIAAIIAILFAMPLSAQETLKTRPDAMPWQPDAVKATINMATSVAEMADWDRYPTYETYVAMMQGWAQQYPDLCRLDTIGTSVQGRLILCMKISNPNPTQVANPEFFYSSTMHGDEVTGYYFMLRLIDTLLSSYGTSTRLTQLIDNIDIYINPLSNPDGTYRGGNSTVANAVRYNANNVDLNRNFPDPFGTAPINAQQKENTAMIDYVSNHRFVLSANLHGGAEVMNYPWDSYTTYEQAHPDAEWWKAVGKRFVDTTRIFNSQRFRDVNTAGVIEGGDWYVISNGRQDYMNQVWGCHEITMELSTQKTLPSSQLCNYWRWMCHSLINYIAETPNVPNVHLGISNTDKPLLKAYPNPTTKYLTIEADDLSDATLTDMAGRTYRIHSNTIDLSTYPNGLYLLRVGSQTMKVMKH